MRILIHRGLSTQGDLNYGQGAQKKDLADTRRLCVGSDNRVDDLSGTDDALGPQAGKGI